MKARSYIFTTLALSAAVILSSAAHAQVLTQIIDVTGDGAGATLQYPEGLAVDGNGNVYVAGGGSENVFKITPGGTVTEHATLAGTNPGRIGVDGAGNVFVQDINGTRVFKITPSGTVNTVLTQLGDGGGNLYDTGEGLAVAASGIAYASGSGCNDPNPGPCPAGEDFQNVFRISPSALPELVLDKTGGGLVTLNASDRYEALTVDSSGNLFASNNGGNAVFKVTPTNQVSIVIDPTLKPGFFSPIAVATDAAGNLYVINEVEDLYKITPAGVITQLPDVSGSVDFAVSIAAGPVGSLYLAGLDSDTVVQLLPDGTTTVIIDNDGDGVHPFELPDPGALAVDSSGTVYVAGNLSQNAFKIVPPGPFELDRSEQKCVNALNKGLRKVSRAEAREVSGCIEDSADGDLGSMLIEECVTADRRERVAKAQAKVVADGTKACGSVDPPFGATSAAIVNTAALNSAKMLAHDLFGDDIDAAVVPDAPASHDEAVCQAAVTQSLNRCLDTYLNAFPKCKKTGLKNGSIIVPSGIASCIGSDPKGKIADACAASGGAVRETLDERCSGVDLPTTFPGRCALNDIPSVAQCMDEAALCRTCRAAKNADDLAVDCDTLDDGLENGSCVIVCGDDMIESYEECDDGNAASGDGCSAACQIESCGDGVTQNGLGEQCDDGNLESYDGCSAGCIIEFCGDGIANNVPNEECDGADDNLCAGACQPNCTCSVPITVGTHECRPAAGSVLANYDHNGPPIDATFTDGAIEVDCGQVDNLTGRATCTCEVTEPLVANGLGLTLCIVPTGQSCAAGEIDCDGGDALDVAMTTEHDIGACTGHASCATQCDTYCAGIGADAVNALCEGYCDGGANNGLACTTFSNCPGGTCVGYSPVSNSVFHPNVCGCHCQGLGGSAGASGALTCQVAVEMTVEMFPPCGDGDDFLHLGAQCMQLTSETTEVTLLETNLGTIGPISTDGAAKQCVPLGIVGARNLGLTGSINTIHGNLDRDVADVVDLVCE
jgi:cysteine-rich repeat protein